MLLVRGMDILVARKHPTDDGVFADLTHKQRMPICVSNNTVALRYTQESKKSGTNDIFCLVKALDRLFVTAGAPSPFKFGTGLDG